MTIESSAPAEFPSPEALKVLREYSPEQLAEAHIHALQAQANLNTWVECIQAEIADRNALPQEPPAETLES